MTLEDSLEIIHKRTDHLSTLPLLLQPDIFEYGEGRRRIFRNLGGDLSELFLRTDPWWLLRD